MKEVCEEKSPLDTGQGFRPNVRKKRDGNFKRNIPGEKEKNEEKEEKINNEEQNKGKNNEEQNGEKNYEKQNEEKNNEKQNEEQNNRKHNKEQGMNNQDEESNWDEPFDLSGYAIGYEEAPKEISEPWTPNLEHLKGHPNKSDHSHLNPLRGLTIGHQEGRLTWDEEDLGTFHPELANISESGGIHVLCGNLFLR